MLSIFLKLSRATKWIPSKSWEAPQELVGLRMCKRSFFLKSTSWESSLSRVQPSSRNIAKAEDLAEFIACAENYFSKHFLYHLAQIETNSLLRKHSNIVSIAQNSFLKEGIWPIVFSNISSGWQFSPCYRIWIHQHPWVRKISLYMSEKLNFVIF